MAGPMCRCYGPARARVLPSELFLYPALVDHPSFDKAAQMFAEQVKCFRLAAVQTDVWVRDATALIARVQWTVPGGPIYEIDDPVNAGPEIPVCDEFVVILRA